MKKLILFSLFILVGILAYSLTETKTLESVQVLKDGQIQIRETVITYNGTSEVSRNYHRHCLDVGGNTTKEYPAVQNVTNQVWTPVVVSARNIAKIKTVAK